MSYIFDQGKQVSKKGLKNSMNLVGILLLSCLIVNAQTRVNLREQSKDVDFGSAASTRPAKTGTTLPSTCQVGDLYFKSNEVAGSNLYGCTATPNVWSVLSGANKSEISFCVDQGLVNAFSCNLNPTIGSYQTGVIAQFRANSTNTGPATVNFNSLGPKAIKKYGNQELQNLDIIAGQIVTLVYDGSVFQMQSHLASFLQAGGSGLITVNRNVYPWTVDIETSLLCTVTGSCAPTGAFDLSNSSMTKPSRVTSVEPEFCSEGESYYNTSTHKRRNCTGLNTWSDEAADQAGPVFSSGFGWFAPFGSGATNAITLTPEPQYFQMVIPRPTRLGGLTLQTDSDAAPNSAVAVAVYSDTGTRITGAFGSINEPAQGSIYIATASPVNLSPGVYYIGIASEDATLSVRVTDVSAPMLNANGALRVVTGSSSTSGTGGTFTLPSTMGTLSAVDVRVPVVYMLP